MQAITFESFGDAEVLQLTHAPDPVLRPDDLLVRVGAAGVNRADLNQRRGAYGRADFGDSTLMGLEVAGEVVAVGAQVSGWQPGDRVMAVVGGGAYAELARFDHRMAMPIPAGLSYEDAAAIPEVFVTAHEALFHLARLQPHETVLVHAAGGGVGSAAVQLAHAAGARVLATAGGSKRAAVQGFGADVAIDYQAEDFAEAALAATQGAGVDVVIDFIGAPYLERNVNLLKEGGRLVQVGLMGGRTPASLPLERVLFRHLQIFGTVMKSRPPEVKQAMVQRFAERWLPAFTDGRLRPVVDRVYPLREAAEAHRRMEAGANVGKLILVP